MKKAHSSMNYRDWEIWVEETDLMWSIKFGRPYYRWGRMEVLKDDDLDQAIRGVQHYIDLKEDRVPDA